MNLNYYLQGDKKANKPLPIALYVRKSQAVLTIPTGKKILPSEWDFEKKEPLGNKHNLLKIFLKRLSGDVSQSILQYQTIYLKATTKNVFDHLRDMFVNKNNATAPSLSIFNAIENEADKKNTRKTKRNYLSLSQQLIKCFSVDKPISDFTKDDFMRFRNTLKNSKLKESTTNLYLHTLKTVLNANDIEVSKWKIDIKPLQKVIIRLSKDELEIIEKATFDNEKLEYVRYLFLFSCYTLQRLSDVINFDLRQVENNVWYFTQKKTNTKIAIPLSVKALEIAKNLVKCKLTENQVTYYIKIIGKQLQYNRLITYDEKKNGIKTTISKPLYELFTFHSGRKTGASILYWDFQIPAAKVMKLTGHSTMASFLRYVGESGSLEEELNDLVNLI